MTYAAVSPRRLALSFTGNRTSCTHACTSPQVNKTLPVPALVEMATARTAGEDWLVRSTGALGSSSLKKKKKGSGEEGDKVTCKERR